MSRFHVDIWNLRGPPIHGKELSNQDPSLLLKPRCHTLFPTATRLTNLGTNLWTERRRKTPSTTNRSSVPDPACCFSATRIPQYHRKGFTPQFTRSSEFFLPRRARINRDDPTRSGQARRAAIQIAPVVDLFCGTAGG